MQCIENTLKPLGRRFLALEKSPEQQVGLNSDGSLERAEIPIDQESDPPFVSCGKYNHSSRES
jgi:hypothetical protein